MNSASKLQHKVVGPAIKKALKLKRHNSQILLDTCQGLNETVSLFVEYRLNSCLRRLQSPQHSHHSSHQSSLVRPRRWDFSIPWALLPSEMRKASGSCESLKSSMDEQLDDDWMSVIFSSTFCLLISD